MPLLLALAFLVVPIVEIAVLLRVQREIGLPETLGLLIAMSLLGGYLVKREGARAWRAFRSASAAGRLPAREVADGALVLFGGALLLTPGFVTDLLGLLLILPPTRAIFRRGLSGFFARRLLGGTLGPVGRGAYRGRGGAGGPVGGPPTGPPGGSGAPGRGAPSGPMPRVIEGEIEERPDR